MFIVLCAFLVASFFELKALFKSKEKKEAAVYIVISVAAVSLAAFLMLAPDHTSFADMILRLFNISQ